MLLKDFQLFNKLQQLRKDGSLQALLHAGYLSPSAFTHLDISTKFLEYKSIVKKRGKAVKMTAEFFRVSVQYVYRVLNKAGLKNS